MVFLRESYSYSCSYSYSRNRPETRTDIERVHATGLDHERLDVYRLTIEFVAWVGVLIDERMSKTKPSAIKHLDEASTSIALNIAEGNGKRSVVDPAFSTLLAVRRLSPPPAWTCLRRASDSSHPS